MLVLSRRPGERQILETKERPIEMVLHQKDGGRVKLGITAPPTMRLLREELFGEPSAA